MAATCAEASGLCIPHQLDKLLPFAKDKHNWAHRQESVKPGFPYELSRRCRYKICEFHLKV